MIQHELAIFKRPCLLIAHIKQSFYKVSQQLKKSANRKPVKTIHIKNAFPLIGSHLE